MFHCYYNIYDVKKAKAHFNDGRRNPDPCQDQENCPPSEFFTKDTKVDLNSLALCARISDFRAEGADESQSDQKNGRRDDRREVDKRNKAKIDLDSGAQNPKTASHFRSASSEISQLGYTNETRGSEIKRETRNGKIKEED